MATNEALEERVDRLQTELDRREASKTTSERQAAILTARGRNAEPDDDRDEDERPEAWGGDGADERSRGDAASRRQASRITRGASRRSES